MENLTLYATIIVTLISAVLVTGVTLEWKNIRVWFLNKYGLKHCLLAAHYTFDSNNDSVVSIHKYRVTRFSLTKFRGKIEDLFATEPIQCIDVEGKRELRFLTIYDIDAQLLAGNRNHFKLEVYPLENNRVGSSTVYKGIIYGYNYHGRPILSPIVLKGVSCNQLKCGFSDLEADLKKDLNKHYDALMKTIPNKLN